MDNDVFNSEVEHLMSKGLTPSDAITFLGFMNCFKPHELEWHSAYYYEWIERFKKDRFSRMDNDCLELYASVELRLESFVESL